jgi:drug/metabolite transporter (DMT)-like permease
MISPRAATLLGLLAMVFWTTSVAVVRHLVVLLGPWTYLSVTSLAAGALLMVWAQLRRRSFAAAPQLPRKYLLAGGACFVTYFALFAVSQRLARTHDVAVQLGLVNYLWPAFILLLSVPLLGHRARWWMLLPGIAVATCGAAVGTVRGVSLGGIARSVAANPLAFALMLVAALSWGAFSNLARRYHADRAPGGVGTFLLATGLLSAGARFAAGEVWQWQASLAAPLIYAAVFPSAVAYALWETAMRRGDVTLLGAASYLLPLASTAFSCWYLGVAPRGSLFAGAVLVMAGAVLSKCAIRPGRPGAAEPDRG